jgi:hypothetical protein
VTERENAVNSRHNEVFALYKAGNGDLECIVNVLTNDYQNDLGCWLVSDLLHFMKNARGLMLEQIGTIFQARKPLDFLKDDFVIAAFTLENLLLLWQRGDATGAYVLLYFAAVSLAVRQQGIRVQIRLALIQTAFSVCFKMATEYSSTGRWFGISERTESCCPRKTRWTKQMCVRAFNPGGGLHWVVKHCGSSKELWLGECRIGSHSVECHFRTTRNTLNAHPRWERYQSKSREAKLLA